MGMRGGRETRGKGRLWGGKEGYTNVHLGLYMTAKRRRRDLSKEGWKLMGVGRCRKDNNIMKEEGGVAMESNRRDGETGERRNRTSDYQRGGEECKKDEKEG